MTDNEFLKQYDSSVYDKPSVAVDLLVFTISDDRLKILLTKRDQHPFMGMPALPGVFVRMDETLDEAAGRGAMDKAGVRDIYFEQLYTWSDIDRDPRMRIISVSYISFTNADRLENISSGSALYDVEDILSDETQLAFDHKKMIRYGRERIRNKVGYSDIAFEFIPEKFTLPQLQRVYEILLGKKLYKANFRKQISSRISETDEMITGNAHRPSRVYTKRNENEYPEGEEKEIII